MLNMRRIVNARPLNAHFASLKFKVAAEIWCRAQKPRWKKATAESYLKYVGWLNSYFADLRLQEIDIHHFREYQKINSTLRADGRPRFAPSSVNHDLNTLLQVLSVAGLAKRIRSLYQELPVPRWTPPRILSEEEEDRFFKIAASNPAFVMAYWVSSVTNNTSASGSELRKLQLKHLALDSDPPRVYVPSETVRNEFGAREIPLNDRGVMQAKRILQRARSLGCTQPDHYLFPLRVHNSYDPTRPASAWFIYKQWNRLLKAAIEQGAITRPIKPFDMRYNVVVKMLKAGAAEYTVKSIAGHVRREMLEHFSRRRLEDKTKVLNMINPVKKIEP
jgi:hypothetical protein